MSYTPGRLRTEPGNAVSLSGPMGRGSREYRIIWSAETQRDVCYVLPPPVVVDDEGDVAVSPLDDAAEIVRRWNAFPDLLAACKAWDEGFTEGEQFTPEQFRVWVNERRRMAREAIAAATAVPEV